MIIVTGGAGFIGSAFVWKLNQEGIEDIVIVDRLGKTDKWKNLVNLRFVNYIHKDEFYDLIYNDTLSFEVEAIIHMGACSSTTERDADYLWQNNFAYTRPVGRMGAGTQHSFYLRQFCRDIWRWQAGLFR